jgi:hypothetical protein
MAACTLVRGLTDCFHSKAGDLRKKRPWPTKSTSTPPGPLGKTAQLESRIGAGGAATANAQKRPCVVYIARRCLITSPRNGYDTNTRSCLPVIAVDLLTQSMCFGEKACQLDLLLDHRQRRLQPTHFVVRDEWGHLRRRHQWIVLHTSRSLKSATELREQVAAAMPIIQERSRDSAEAHSRRASLSMLTIVDAKTPVAITSRIMPEMVLSTDASSISRVRNERAVPTTAL